MQVSEILRVKGNTLYTVPPEEKLSEAVMLMADRDLGSLIVMDSGRLVGVLTFREIIRVGANRVRQTRTDATLPMGDIEVRAVMNTSPTVVSPATDVMELRRTMLESHQRYFPVMDGTMLMGVVSFHDVAKAVLEEQSFENRMLKAYIRDWPGEDG